MITLQFTQEELRAFKKVQSEVDFTGAQEFGRLDDDEAEAFDSFTDKIMEALDR